MHTNNAANWTVVDAFATASDLAQQLGGLF